MVPPDGLYLLLKAERMSMFWDSGISKNRNIKNMHKIFRLNIYLKKISSTEQTFDLQVKRAAIKFVFVGDLTSVISCIILLCLDDVHLKRVNL